MKNSNIINKHKPASNCSLQLVRTHAYPAEHVITIYTFFGGIIGGIILFGSVGVIELLRKLLRFSIDKIPNYSIDIVWFISVIFSILFIMVASFIVGLIPALVTGCAIAKLKVTRSKKGLLSAFVIGFIATIIVALTFIIAIGFKNSNFQDFVFNRNLLSLIAMLGFIGALSSTIIGYKILPSRQLYPS